MDNGRRSVRSDVGEGVTKAHIETSTAGKQWTGRANERDAAIIERQKSAPCCTGLLAVWRVLKQPAEPFGSFTVQQLLVYGRARSLVSVSRSPECDYDVVRVRLCAIYTALAIVFRFTSQSPERGRAVVCGLTFRENPHRGLIIINFRGFISSRISCVCGGCVVNWGDK